MSANTSETVDSTEEDNQTTQSRQVARRVFAGEYNMSGHTFKEGSGDNSPNFLTLPSMEKANRVFFVGTITEKEDVGSDDAYWRAEINDSTGTFYVYAGQYQPEAAAMIRSIETPAYVAVVGKPNTFENEDGEMLISVRPEHIFTIDEAFRDKWILDTAESTLNRLDNLKDLTSEDIVDENFDVFNLYGDEVVEDVRDVVIDALDNLEETRENRE